MNTRNWEQSLGLHGEPKKDFDDFLPLPVIEQHDGYELHTISFIDSMKAAQVSTITSAFTPGGAYIGNQGVAEWLSAKHIVPELADPDSRVCTVGFREEDQKWFGWSTHAIAGFGLGDRIFEPDFGTDDTDFIKHGAVVIKNMKDARTAAVAFAEFVS